MNSAEVQTSPPEPVRQVRPRLTVGCVIRRTLLVIITVILVLVVGLLAMLYTLVTGPSESMRDQLVLSATQASATKWIPGLFIGQAKVDEIVEKSAQVQEEVIQMGDQNTGAHTADGEEVENWDNAIDGMIFKNKTTATFHAYILLVKDPSRVYVGTSSDYHSGKTGARIFDEADQEGAIAAINAGEFKDTNGQGTGDTPIGLTYSKGQCVWDDKAVRTFIGFDDNGVLHAADSMTRAQADELGIRDAVSFQNGNTLITNDGTNVSLYYAEGNVGLAQRTAIAQRADGTVILVVTDGRSASSLGATRNDIIDLLVEEGAVVAGMLDGGSSAMMYYPSYYEKYGVDTSGLDEYQKMGLVNQYKAFTTPRHMPTFFLVAPES